MKNLQNFLIRKDKVIRYIFAGIVASFSNFLVLYILVQKFNLWYLFSSVISFCCGIVVSYTLHKFFAFKNYSTKDMPMQFSVFVI
ncbi:MAG: GtrA family protein, partial [archaeon]|nr:GtrA family protein [archaeon]